MPLTRRSLLAAVGVAPLMSASVERETRPKRTFEVCLSPDALRADSDLLRTVAEAGVSGVWLTGFLYGHWPYPLAENRRYAEQARALGMAAHMINVPLGHPGDSLGAMNGDVPLTPPKHWRMGLRPDGSAFSGTSLHQPATDENVRAVRAVANEGYRRIFLDDDFRLAPGPGMVGGCFCAEHRAAFLSRHGFAASRFDELVGDIAARRLAPIVRAWVDDACDELTESFRAQRAACRPARLGNMVMFMGSEQGGIRLADYRQDLFRVGELHFDDASFGTPKGKTNELFSSLFHRRFARPALAYSETTAYPATSLSASNMAAKLTVSTISDVRTTCYMSGLSPFPKAHWEVLGPRMKHEAAIHEVIAGHKQSGPLKHWWGEAGRYVGDANPYSLFLSLGLPFEVCSAEPASGWVFLGDQDAAHAPQGRSQSACKPVHRPGVACAWPGARAVPELRADLLRLKAEVLAADDSLPHIVEDNAVVLAWYPTARSAVLWNLDASPVNLTFRCRGRDRRVPMSALGSEIVRL
ncbi:MAG: hypothetical protein FJX72_10525 [Armatimonadetes bacterium]|nr:hypothetical protein [Armatimonadota bacterium]